MIRFGNTEALIFLVALPVIIGLFLLRWRVRVVALKKIGSRELISKYEETGLPEKRLIKAIFIVLAFFLIIIALARPQWGSRMEEVSSEGIDIIFALDTSLSMRAEDVKPNRLDRAKMEIASFIDSLRGNQVGLVCFAGSSYVQCPLTLDYSAAKLFIDIVDTEIIPDPGTALGEAIRTAIGAFNRDKESSKVLILVTDGEDHDSDPIKAAKEAAKAGIIIHTVGVGSPEGEPIPIKDSNGKLKEYKKNSRGEPVVSKLDERTLIEIASITDGIYTRSERGVELNKVFEQINEMKKTEFETELHISYTERFQWFLSLALIFLLLDCLITNRK